MGLSRWFRGDLPDKISGATFIVLFFNLLVLVVTLIVEGHLAWNKNSYTIWIYIANSLAILSSLYYRWLQWAQVLNRFKFFKRVFFELLLLLIMLIGLEDVRLFGLIGALRAIYLAFISFKSTQLGGNFFKKLAENPAQIFAVSFLVVILSGALLLMLPRATTDLKGSSIVDAVFTSTSAVCVTGLTVLNTGPGYGMDPHVQTLTTFGQIIVLILIQIGGLGIMTLSTAAVLLTGGKLSLKDKKLMADIMDEDATYSMLSLIKRIIVMTVTFEGIGALLLFLRFYHYTEDLSKAIYLGIFHSISAFNNAGFSTYPTSLMSFAMDPIIPWTVALLIVFGGLGFSVIHNLFSRELWKNGFRVGIRKMPVHSKLVIVSTLFLIFGGMFLILIFDYNGALANMSFGEKLAGALFQSITTRTAGFNTIDISALTRSAALIYVVLMFIGASPGGTGGGIKTTTVGVFIASLISMIRGREDFEIFERQVPKKTVQKAVAIIVLSFTLVFTSIILLFVTQKHIDTIPLIFEAFSAFGTVGLSMGATHALNPVGKWIIILLMYVGRIGPVTLALAVASRRSRARIKYPEGKIAVG